MNRRLDVCEVKRWADGRWLEILAQLAPGLEAALVRPGRHVACPVHGGRDGFRLFRDAAATGGGICNTCGAFADGLALLMWVNDWSFRQTLVAIAEILGVAVPDDPVRPRAPARTRDVGREPADPSPIRASLQHLWREAVALGHPGAVPVRRYLNHRRLTLPEDVVTLRCHRRLAAYDGSRRLGDYPALLALASDPLGRPVTLHRTYLTAEGVKAPIPSPKRTMAYGRDQALTGGAVRLGPVRSELGIAEGIETALAVRLATGMVTWAALSATLLERFVVPVGVERLWIWADFDPPAHTGERAAAALAAALADRPVDAVIRVPPPRRGARDTKRDWADVWYEAGAGVFPRRQLGM